jgi:hypothetical protein
MSRYGISEIEQRELFTKSVDKYDENYYCEVPVFCRSVDLVTHNIKKNTITAIEFKLTDWKRAIKQALNVAICFDYIEICVPIPQTAKGQKAILDCCGELGIGVYFIDIDTKQFSHPLLPQQIQKVWEIQRTQVINALTGG